MLLGAEDIGGQTVSTTQADPAQIDYIYNFEDIFATPQQSGFYGSAGPYGVPLATAKAQNRPQGLGSIMNGPLNMGGPYGPPPQRMAVGGKVDYDFLGEISQIMSFGEN